MKEMSAAGTDHHRQLLWSGPIHHGGQWNSVIALAMDHQAVLMRLHGQRAGRKMAHRRAHQYDFF